VVDLRDDLVIENHGEEGNFFSLREGERTTIRKAAVRKSLEANPGWLEKHVEWALAQVEDGSARGEEVIHFAVDLLASRFATIWSNQKSLATRKQRDCQNRETKRARVEIQKCDDCQGEMVWCCSACKLPKMNVSPDTSYSDCRPRGHHHHRLVQLLMGQTKWTLILTTPHKRKICRKGWIAS